MIQSRIYFKDLEKQPQLILNKYDYLVLYCNYSKHDSNWFKYLKNMPKNLKEEILGYQKKTDKYNSLFGKYLVYVGFLLCSGEKISFQKYLRDQYGKPLLKSKDALNFNISHSRTTVTCVFSYANVGIDIEVQKERNYQDFKSVFSVSEYEKIMQEGKSTFYDFWTKKEAILKLIGKGFSTDPTTIEIQSKNATHESDTYYHKSFFLNKGVKGAIASKTPIKKILFAEIFF